MLTPFLFTLEAVRHAECFHHILILLSTGRWQGCLSVQLIVRKLSQATAILFQLWEVWFHCQHRALVWCRWCGGHLALSWLFDRGIKLVPLQLSFPHYPFTQHSLVGNILSDITVLRYCFLAAGGLLTLTLNLKRLCSFHNCANAPGHNFFIGKDNLRASVKCLCLVDDGLFLHFPWHLDWHSAGLPAKSKLWIMTEYLITIAGMTRNQLT